MSDLGGTVLPTTTPLVYDYSYIGTAASTTTVQSYPCVLHSITIVQGVAAGKVIIYDSAGTSATVIGSIVLGTQLVSNLTATYTFDVRTKNALTVENTANLGAVVSFGR